MQNLKMFTKFLKKNSYVVVGAFLLSLISAFVVIAFTFVLRFVLDETASSSPVFRIGLLIAFVFLMFVFQLIKSKTVINTSLRIQADILSEYFTNVYNLPLQKIQTTDPGEFLQRIIDVIYVEASLFKKGIPFIVDLCFLVFSVGILTYLNPVNLVFFVVIFPFYFLLQKHLNKKQEQNASVWRKSEEKLTGTILDDLKNILVLKSFNCTNLALDKVAKTQEELLKALATMDTSTVYRNSFTLLFNHLLLVLIFIFQLAIAENNMGQLVQSISLVMFIFGPISGVASYFDDLQKGKVSAGRLSDIMSQSPQKKTPALPTEKHSVETVKIDNVSFSYTDGIDILKNIQLTLHKNEYIAIVGETGAGKSTLLNILLGYVTPQSGQVYFDAVPVSDLSGNTLISYVPQQVYIADDTLRGNITLHKTDYSEELFHTVCNKLGIDAIAKKLPQGYDTPIGGNIAGLSQGQCQLISIARALLKNDFQVLVLDEITSALDISSERRVLDAVAEFRDNRIVVVVSHRLTGITNATKIVFLKDEKIDGINSHQQLLEENHHYKELWDKQFAR
ncbi:MAG: ABC transporter ATP-binding protein [Spirochaetales bacterium]